MFSKRKVGSSKDEQFKSFGFRPIFKLKYLKNDFPLHIFRIQFEAWQKFKFWFSFQNYFHFDRKVLGHKSRCKMSFLISQMFANKRNAPTGSSFVFDILYSLKRNRNNVLWEFRNDKKLRKSLVDKFCQVDRLVNFDNSIEFQILELMNQ